MLGSLNFETQLCERRTGARYAMDLEVRYRRAGSLGLGRLRELSRAGIQLQFHGSLRVGERVEVLARPGMDRQSVLCEVVWVRGTLAGLRASLSISWLASLLNRRERPGRPRRDRRFATHTPAEVAGAQGTLLDVSRGGAQVRLAACPALGQTVTLKAGGSALRATVVGSTPLSEDRATVNLRFLQGQAVPLRRLLRATVA